MASGADFSGRVNEAWLAQQREEIIGTLEVSAAEKIAQYRLRIFGAADYPDGTSTPRVEPIRHGVHLPHDSCAQNSIA